MAETHPNAYRQEATEKRAEAARLNSEADQLEAQAEVLDPTPVPEELEAPKAQVKKSKKAQVKK